MQKFFSKLEKSTLAFFFLALAITFTGYHLRVEKYFFFPPLGDTADEAKALFNGLSLINDKVPRSWSFYIQYQNATDQEIRGNKYRIVEPWFDEPPLYSLMMGMYAKSKGLNDINQFDVGVLRWPMFKLAALNTFVIFLILYLLKKPWVGLAASAIYATAPTIVMGSRLAVSDNMIASFALFSVLLLVIYHLKKSSWILFPLIVLSSSSLLLKSTGIFVPMGVLFILIGLKHYRQAVYQVIGIAVFMAIWLGYGAYYDWNLFLQIAQVSSGRELFQPGNLISLFLVWRIGESNASVDGWILWGWLAVVAYTFLFRTDKSKPVLERLILPSMLGSYLVFFSIMSGHNKGWYRFPFYPFLAWAGGEAVVELIRQPRFLPGIFFIGVAVASAWIFGTGEYKFTNAQIRQYQYFFIIITGILMANEIHLPRFKKIAQGLMLVVFLAGIILNIRTIIFFQDHFWYQ